MITRYEETSESLFIRIEHDTIPVHIEHFFSEEERKDDVSRKDTIEKLMAKLEILAEGYIAPEIPVSKVEEAEAYKLDVKKIDAYKIELESVKEETVEEEIILEEK